MRPVVGYPGVAAMEKDGIDILHMALGFLAGLSLFLYGINLLSEGLRAVAGDRMRRLLERFTVNRFAGVATGTAATAALDSSSAVVILTVGLVDAGLLDLSRSLGVVMGANIGTTLSSQVFALDIIEYGPVLLPPGLLLHRLGRSERWRHVGAVMLGLGLVFFALGYLDEVMRPLGQSRRFRAFMLRMEEPLWGVLAGAAFTALIQSSSALMGILIGLVGSGVVTLDAAIALMLGAEIGTCADVLVATVGRSREAVCVGLFQLAFNLASVALFLGLTGPLARIACWISPGSVERQLANAHVLFNVGSVLAFLGFTRTIARGVYRLVPDRPADGADREPAPAR